MTNPPAHDDDKQPTRAQRLASNGQTAVPPAPAPKKTWTQRMKDRQDSRYKRGDPIGLVFLKRGTLDHFKVKDTVVQRSHGAYIPQGTPFRVPCNIPRGSLIWTWPEGDPEPFTGREPIGYGAKWLQNFIGGIRSYAALAGIKTGPELGFIGKTLFIVLAVLVVCGGLYWWFTTKGGSA